MGRLVSTLPLAPGETRELKVTKKIKLSRAEKEARKRDLGPAGNDVAEIGYSVADFISGPWPASLRNDGRHQIGIGGRLASESAIFPGSAV